MSESQAIDKTRVWWKEWVKRQRVRLFDAALVGGPAHRDYLVQLGMPRDRIAMGYNAVDNAYFAAAARRWRDRPDGRHGLPTAPYFLTVCRFVPDKNLVRLVEAFARYRRGAEGDQPWELVLCGDGPGRDEVAAAIADSGFADVIHRPGFLQVDELPRWYAHAGAFVLPSLLEPWGLVANEAAASELPLVISRRAGCAATLVPDPPGTTGARFDPLDVAALAETLASIASTTSDSLAAMGRRAAEVVSFWGPGRFAEGVLEAVELARDGRGRRRVPSAQVLSERR
jgi:glycosyltransferase involved in cell wall biosynthesis